MISFFKNKKRKYLGPTITEPFSTAIYSQEGEDMILSRIFENEPTGFYIEVGALHPQRYSNSMIFYKRGWRGINIDAMPGSMALFNIERPEDINLEIAISDHEEILTYYIFNEPALNTFSEVLANEYVKNSNFKILQKLPLQTRMLESVLNEHLDEDKKINFLSIDAEGLDFSVLKSNNWIKYRPLVVLVECLDFEINVFLVSELYKFMCEKGYVFYCKTVNTVFFKLQK